MGIHRRSHLLVLGSLSLLVVTQVAIPTPPAAAAAAPTATPSQPAQASASPTVQPKTNAPSRVGADGKPLPTTTHFDPVKSKEVPTLDQHLKLFDNPDGTHTLRIGIGPLKGVDESGNGGDLDLSLVNDKAGNLRPHRTVTSISIAPASGPRTASVELAPGKFVDLAVDGITSGVGATRVHGQLGESVRFDRVLPQNTSLLVRPRTDGVETTYEIQAAAAATNLTEHITLPAGYAARQANGYIEIIDDKGAAAGRWIGGLATDSSPPALDTEVTLKLQSVQGGVATAQVIVSPTWLADPKRVYPVSIDPAVVRESSSQAGYGATYIELGDAYPHWGIDPVRIGTYDSGANVNRTFIKFPIDGIPTHSRIVGATMGVLETWSWSCQARAMAVHRVPNYWDGNITWATGNGDWAGSPESSISVAAGYTPGGCGAAWEFMDLSSLVADWYYLRYPLYGVMMKANDESDNFSWKKFAGSFSGNGMFVDVTYESFGNQPIAIDDAHLQQPATVGTGYQTMTLTNQGSDTWPAYGPYQVGYHLYNSAGQYLHDGPATVLPSTVNPGGSTTINATIEALPMGTYTVAWDMLEQNVIWFSSVGIPTTNRSYRSNAPPTMAALQSPAPGYAQIPSGAFGAYPTSGSTTSYTASFEVWFKTTAGGVILGQTSNVLPPNTLTSGWVPALYVDSNGALRDSIFWHTNGSGNVAPGPYNDGKPHHVVAAYGNGVDSLFVDGSLVSSTSVNVTGFANTYAYLLGTGYTTSWANTYNGGWFPFAGTLDEVAVYNTALNLTQVQAHYGAATGTSYKTTILGDGPTAYYRMDDSPGASTLADSSGHANPATWSGGAGTSDPSLLSGDSDAAMGIGRAQVASATPTLSAASSDPDGDPLQYLFRICSGIDAESGACTDSGWISTSSWTVPAGKLSPGATYYWHTWVTDGGSYGQVSPPAPYSLTVTLPSAQPAWSYGFDPYAAYHGGVNTAIGNYVYSNTDFAFPSVGPPMQLVRTYNSMDMAPNGQGRWFGLGWTSTFETSLTFDSSGNGTVTYPDGRREFLTSNGDGTYAPAFGFASSMSKVVVSGTTYYDLKHRDQSVWRFNSSGTLVSMTDAYGHQLQLVWSSTAVTISDPSGHSLAVTFSAPLASAGRVTQVVSSPVTVGGSPQALKWTYSYDGNGQLASACDPTDTPSSRVCTNYTNSGPGNRLSGIVKPNGNGLVTLTYDTSNRISTRKDGLNNTMTFNYGLPASGAPSGTVGTTSATDALNHTTQSSYNNLNQLLQHINEDGSARTYTFDQRGFLGSITDENGNVSAYTNDTAGNVLQFKDGAGDVTYYAYDSANRRTAARDPRSSGPTDNTYLTTYAYDSSGNLISETTPAGTKKWTYTTGTEAAIGGGVMPPNLMLIATDAMGHTTTYAYDSLGNPRRRTDPSGLVTDRTFDELGRELSRKETSDSYPSGLLTTITYDLAGRTAQLTEPLVTNVVTGVNHQRTTTLAYDKNGNLTTLTVADATGGDASRKTGYGYDNDDRQTSVTDPLNHTSTTTYDAVGNVVQAKDALGRVTSTSYTTRSQPSTVKLLSFIDDPINPGTPRDVTINSYTYDPGGRKLTETDSLSRQTKYAYDQANRLTTATQLGYHNRDNTTRDVVLETRSYDAAGNVKQRVEAGLRTTDYTYDTAERLLTAAEYRPVDGPTGARATSYTYDANGNVLSRTLSMGSSTAKILYGYDLDQAARRNKVEAVNQGSLTAPNADQVTTYTYDQRSLQTSMTEPRGNYGGANPASFTTTFSYDPAGRLTTTVAPAVQVELGGPPATIPGAPTGVTATAGNGQATVTWTAPASNGGSALSGYTVTASPGGQTATVNGSTTTAVVSGLSNGTPYTFTVTASNAVGTGPGSAASNSVTPTAPPAGIAVDQRIGLQHGGPLSTLTSAPFTVKPQAGDLIAVPMWGYNLTVSSVADSAGNTYVRGAQSVLYFGMRVEIWYAKNVSVPSGSWTVTVNTSPQASDLEFDVVALSGADQSAPLDAAATNSGGDPTAANSGSVSVASTQAGDYFVGAMSTNSPSSNVNLTTPSPWVQRDIDPNNSAAQAGQVADLTTSPPAGSQTWSFSWTTPADTWVAALAAFKSAGGTAPSAPGAPTGVTATAGNGQATVSWTAPASNGGSAITGYTVTASPGAQTVTVNGSTTTATVSGLSNGTAYTFTVSATNAVGTGPASSVSNSVTPSAPSASPAPSAGVVVDQRIGLQHGGPLSTLTSAPFAVKPAAGDVIAVPIWGYNLTVSSVTDSAGNTYARGAQSVLYFGMRAEIWYAKNVTVPSGSWTVTVNTSPQASDLEFDVVALSGADQSNPLDAAATASGGDLTSANSGSVSVASSQAGDYFVGVMSTNSPSSNVNLASASPWVQRDIDPNNSAAQAGQVADLTTSPPAGSQTWSFSWTTPADTWVAGVAAFKASAGTAPGAPTGVTATPGNGQAQVSWTAPSSNGGSAITGYTVTSSPGGLTATVNGSTTTAAVIGLTNATAYTFTVTATNAIGTGPASAPSAAVTPSATLTAPGAPIGVTAVAGNGQAQVSWTAPASNGGSAITSYAVTASPGGKTVTVGGGSAGTTVLGLGNGIGYTFTVTATNSVGTGPASAPSGMVVPTSATSQQPTGVSGYDTFGDLTQVRDAAGNVTSYTYDALGHRTGIAYPTYVTPGGLTVNASESWQYDAVGNVLKWTDRRGQSTTYDYDMRNRVVRQTDPKVSGQALAGVVRYTYDDASNRLSVLDQSAALQQWGYDDRNRVRTHTVVERVPAPTTNYTWTYDYDDLGRGTYQATPLGEVTTRQFDVLGDVTQETDPLGKVVTATYDLAGRLLSSTDQLGRSTQITYDQAGNKEQVQRIDATGARQAYASWFYDVAGNVVGTSQNGGAQTGYSLDALGRPSSITEPVAAGVSITTAFGYDAKGNRTRVTDANGHSTMTYYNVWNLPQNRLEASTAAYPNLSDRTWTWTYDSGGLPVTEAQPGGVTLSKTYDELGRLLQVVGTGAGGNATASYGWDLVGNQLSASSTGGGQSFAYNDRGQLVSASGVAGSSTFGYDGDGQLVTRNDASGSTSFGWSARGELTSITEPLTGVKETLIYDDAGQLSHIAFGSGGPTRDYQYDALGHLTSDIVKNPTGAAVYQAGYGYDANGNLTQKTLGAGQAGAGTQRYTYDWSNRLTSWTDPANNVASYTWDGGGNRTQAGSQTFTYDERNRLGSGGGKTYTWTARGDLLTETSATVQNGFSYDALGRLTQVLQTAQPPLSGSTTIGYAYDGMDRVVKRNSVAWAYAGTSSKPSSDGSTLISRTHSGLGVLATQSGPASQLAVQGAHGDLEASLNSSGVPQGSFAYDPFGNALSGGSGSSVLGYQGEWTDSATSKVSMAARWYDAGTGRFVSRDSVQPGIKSGVDTNLYAYGRANPLVNRDPSGHDVLCFPECITMPGFGQGIQLPGPTYQPYISDPAQAMDWILGRGQAQAQQPASLSIGDRWYLDPSWSPAPISTPITGSGSITGSDSVTGLEAGPCIWGCGGYLKSQLRITPPPPPPPLQINLGGGRIFLPTGAKAPTGLKTVSAATPWKPPSTDCNGCTELVTSIVAGLSSILPGAFSGSPPDGNDYCNKPRVVPLGYKDPICDRNNTASSSQWVTAAEAWFDANRQAISDDAHVAAAACGVATIGLLATGAGETPVGAPLAAGAAACTAGASLVALAADYDRLRHGDVGASGGDLAWDAAGVVPDVGALGATGMAARYTALARGAGVGRMGRSAMARALWAKQHTWSAVGENLESVGFITNGRELLKTLNHQLGLP